jgi:hypothetical protein
LNVGILAGGGGVVLEVTGLRVCGGVVAVALAFPGSWGGSATCAGWVEQGC